MRPFNRFKHFISNLAMKRYWQKIEKRTGTVFFEGRKSDNEHYSNYELTPVHHLRFCEKFLNSMNITENDAIIDIGCGRGGMLLFFSNYSFGKISGLEYLPELASDCRENIKSWKIDADVINANAEEFDGYDSYNYFYLFNPFDDYVMDCFVKNLMKSIERKPRETYVLYVNSMYTDGFIENGFSVVSKFKKSMLHNKESMILKWSPKKS